MTLKIDQNSSNSSDKTINKESVAVIEIESDLFI